MSQEQQQPPQRLCPFSLTSRVIKSSLAGGREQLQALGTPCIGPGCMLCVGLPQPDGTIAPVCGMLVQMQATDALLTKVVEAVDGKKEEIKNG